MISWTPPPSSSRSRLAVWAFPTFLPDLGPYYFFIEPHFYCFEIFKGKKKIVKIFVNNIIFSFVSSRDHVSTKHTTTGLLNLGTHGSILCESKKKTKKT